MGNYFFFRILEGKYSLYKKIMLYKKYHRNFVKQFRKGVKLEWHSDVYTYQATAITNPSVGLTLSGRHDISIETAEKSIVSLVYWSGRLVRIYVV